MGGDCHIFSLIKIQPLIGWDAFPGLFDGQSGGGGSGGGGGDGGGGGGGIRIRIGIFIVPVEVYKEICLTVHTRK